MLELEAAIQRILAHIPPPQTERVAIRKAHSRIVTERILSAVNLPGFDNSAMDGYALRATDVRAATAGTPVPLQVDGRVAAGEIFAGEVATGKCVRVFTGSPLPRGTDAVVMQEDTRLDPALPDAVLILDPVKPWENVRFQGEDVKCGAVVAEASEQLTASRLALLAAAGIGDVSVGRLPIMGLLATGSELLELGQPPSPGQIYESNRAALAALARQSGAIPKIYPLVKDSLPATQNALATACDECNLVVTSGGVSVGEMDFVKTAFEQLGGELQFWKVGIRPGRPFAFGSCKGKLFFGLPGNPVSAFITFLLLVRPALIRWQGAANVNPPVQIGTLGEPLVNPGDRRHFVRVSINSAGEVRSTGTQASHMLHSLAAANGLVDVPPQTTFPAGRTVPVIRWE
jgi:molybdopterin molybdotransferase